MSDYESILQSANRFRLVQRERKVATWLRGYAVPDPLERYSAENVGLRVLLDVATLSVSDLFEIDGRKDAIVNALARTLGNSYRQDADYSTSYFASLAALTFASAGNFASAKVLASLALQSSDLGTAERWMMEVLAHRRIQLSRTSVPPILISYAQLADHALASGYSEDFERATVAFLKANKEAREALISSDRGLLLLWEKVHARFEELSISKVLRDIGFPNQAYADRLLKSSSLFYPSQVYALLNYPLIQRSEPVFITLPTSTGKSLLGELALVASLTWQPFERWLAVYIAPYRALTTQILRDMRKRLKGAEIFCDMRQGGYLSEEPLVPGQRTIIIATPEAFDGLLRKNPELYSGLAACVFDEFHLIEQQQRGLRYEGLVGRFLRGASGEGWPKIVALSAVVEETSQVEEWLQTGAIVKNEWKPTSRRIAIAHPNRTIEYYTPDEALPGDTETQIVWQGRLSSSTVNVVSVALDQFERFGSKEPVLIVANTRKSTRNIALQLHRSFKVLPKESVAHQKAQEILRRYPYLYTLYDCLKYGIAYHNAALPSWVRTELEHLIGEKQLRFVVSTTTLAEGVDFPFRVVILENWSQFWQFGQRQPMSRLLVRNIAGRGGRAWAYTEGDTILIDTRYGENTTNVTAFKQYIRPAAYGLRSSVLRALRTDSREQSDILADSWSVLESQFLAFLAACRDQGKVEGEFTGSLYASLDEDVGQRVLSITTNLVEELTTATRPVMQKHSPLMLTAFGEAVLRTGLSPRSGVALADFIAAYAPSDAPSEGARRRDRYGIEWIPLVASIWQLLSNQSGTWIRELQTYQFRQVGRRGFPVRRADFNEVVMAWMSGVPLEVIGYFTWRNNKREVQDWLNEERSSPPPAFENWIDELSNFCWDYLSRQWSWVLRGSAEICTYLEEEAQQAQSGELASHYRDLGIEFDSLALRLEFGVSDAKVAEWLRQKCPVDRAKLDALKQKYNSYHLEQPLLAHAFPHSFSEWLQRERSQLIDLQVGGFPRIKILEQDLDDLERFLYQREEG